MLNVAAKDRNLLLEILIQLIQPFDLIQNELCKAWRSISFSPESYQLIQSKITELYGVIKKYEFLNICERIPPALVQLQELIEKCRKTEQYGLFRQLDLGVQSILSDLLDHAIICQPELATRVILLSELQKRFAYQSYLEIGCRDDLCFGQIPASYKIGVDPVSGGTHRMTSDQFFAENKDSFDLIFIDGLHEAGQVVRDIENALKVLNPNGVIVMHDCDPAFEIRQIVPPMIDTWNGDVWKAYINFRTRPDLDLALGAFDHGCGVIRVRPNHARLLIDKTWQELEWEDLEKARIEYLQPKGFQELLEWV